MSNLVQINSIFQEIFDDPQLAIGPDTASTDIPDGDSVAQVKLVLALEEAFAIRFTSDELSSIHTVRDFMTAINRQKGSME